MSGTEAIVLDCGSGLIKAGFAGQELPQNVFPSVLARPRKINNGNDGHQDDVIFGDSALRKRGILSIRYPIEHGIVVNWEDMEKLLHHTFYNELRIDPQNESVFLSEAALNPKANREKSAEILFEKFNIHSMSMASQSILGLYSSGRTNGVVLESGEGVTHCVPIYEGYSLPQAIVRLDLAGRDITDYLVQLLAEKGHKFVSIAEREVVRDIKEKMCFVSQDLDGETEELDVKDKVCYELPDGNDIELGSERCKATEVLFQPKLIGSEQTGITQLVKDSVMKTEVDLRRLFWGNIVLCGGNTMFKGLQKRLSDELSNITPKSVKIKIDAMKNRKYCVWIGASIISNISAFKENWMTKTEFQEHGAQRINAITPI